jgi:hypothetical protein
MISFSTVKHPRPYESKHTELRPCDLAIPLLGMYLEEGDSGYSRGTCTPMFIVALFTIAKYGNSQDAPLQTNGSRKCGIYTQWNFIQPQRRMKFCHWQVNGWN